MASARSRTARIVWLTLGLLMTGIAFVGIFLPVIPTTGPVLLAAFSFSKSSERFDRWLVDHRWFGPTVRSWRHHHGFTQRVKVLAATFIAITFALTTWAFIARGASIWWPVGLDVFAVALTVWIWRRPTVSEDEREVLMAIPYEQLVQQA
jgi:uncharacterized membrane protein YbaN (DUF454 family)